MTAKEFGSKVAGAIWTPIGIALLMLVGVKDLVVNGYNALAARGGWRERELEDTQVNLSLAFPDRDAMEKFMHWVADHYMTDKLDYEFSMYPGSSIWYYKIDYYDAKVFIYIAGKDVVSSYEVV